ncbi:hypothetical protein BT93_E1502 [Corymbia citriodora subsp. variegata]|nr:hypothetical protein BT93_E1502 [Corymbia citriodora subsp. variegata]
MAGLQYYFFPTDFYYPRPKPVAETNAADGNVDPRAVPSSRDNNPEKKTEATEAAAAAAIVDSDVKGESKKPRGNLPSKALVLSPREIGKARRRLKAVVTDSKKKSDWNM